MPSATRAALIGALGLIGWLMLAPPLVAAVEYHLRVVRIPEAGYVSF